MTAAKVFVSKLRPNKDDAYLGEYLSGDGDRPGRMSCRTGFEARARHSAIPTSTDLDWNWIPIPAKWSENAVDADDAVEVFADCALNK